MKPTLKKLLKKLSDGEYHSGQELGDALEITRSAVWKALKQLEEQGFMIESAQSKGYRLCHGISLLDKNKILTLLDDANLSEKLDLILFDEVDSTNDYLMSKIRSLDKQTICLAEKQNNGKGRRGRQWISPYATNLALSISCQFDKKPHELAGLSIVSAIATINTLKNYGVTETLQLKWPNDILCQGKKLVGILSEIYSENNGDTHIVIGIGININISTLSAEKIDQPWIDLTKLVQDKVERNRLTALLIKQLLECFDIFRTQGLQPFIEQWQQYDYLADRRVNVSTPKQQLNGIARGITKEGYLVFENEQKEKITLAAGEVSVRAKKHVNRFKANQRI